MAIGSSGALALNGTIGVELGESAGAKTSMSRCTSGTVSTINTNSSSYPDNITPHAFSEWYSYDHSATASLSGSYGNGANNIIINSSKTGLQTLSINVAGSDYVGSSIIGETGHIYFRMQSINNYRQDAQLVSIDYDGGGYHYLGQPFDAIWYRSYWRTTYLTTNTSYSHTASWGSIPTSQTQGKWCWDTGNTPSASTGQDSGTNGCIYYEGSGSNAADKDIYLRSKEVTFQSNTIKTKWYHYGAGFANPSRVYMGIYIT